MQNQNVGTMQICLVTQLSSGALEIGNVILYDMKEAKIHVFILHSDILAIPYFLKQRENDSITDLSIWFFE